MSGASGTKAEHRLLTVMFCDMVDSTGHQFRLEPERFATILRNYRQIIFERVERHGGYTARVVGDGVLIFFGWPAATGKDAQTAVACGLDIAARMSRGIDTIPIAVRLAVETGWVLVGDLATPSAPRGEIEHATVVGSTANIAARLQQLARQNGVIVGEGTLALLGDRFILDPVDTAEVKLPFPIRAAHVLADAGAGNPLAWQVRRFVRCGALLAGRETLFQQILDRWHEARDGAGQALLLTGDAGIGKSHLLAALLHAATPDQPQVVNLFCTPMARDRSLQPVVDWLRQAIGVDAGAFPDEIRAAAERYASNLGLDTDSAGSVLATLLGAAPGDARAPEQMRRRIFDILADILVRTLDDRPLLLLVEDLHWADPSTIELLDHIAQAAPSRRMMLVVTDRNPFAGVLTHVTHLPVEKLDTAATHRLVRESARRFGVELDDAQQATIAERAEGVALFIEEFVRSLVDRQDTSRHPPGTIGQLLASRLDTLGSARPLALIASVIGREAPLDLLASLSDMPNEAFDAAVERLTSTDVMVRRDAGDRTVLAFRHALLTDAAYGVMDQPQRRTLHLRVARVLQRDSPALATTAPSVLAHHLAEAGETGEAAPLFRAAARAMLNTGAYAEAEGHARRSLAFYEQQPDSSEVLAALMPLGEALIGGRGYADPNVQQVYERGARLAMELGTATALLPPLRGLTSYYQVRGPLARAHDLSAQVLRIARIVDDPAMICQAEQRHGWCLMSQGRLTEAAAMMESALARHLGMPESRRYSEYEDASILIHLAWLDWLIHGREAMAQRVARAVARVPGAPPLRATYVLGFAAVAWQLADDPMEAAGYAERSGAIAREHGIVYWIAMADALAGWAAARRGEREGLVLLREAVAAYDRTQGRVLLPYLLALVAGAEHRVGSGSEALAALERAESVVSAIGAGLYRAPLLRLRARLMTGVVRDRLLEEARAAAEAQGAMAFAALVAGELAGGVVTAARESGLG